MGLSKQTIGGITRGEHVFDKQQRSLRPKGCEGRVCTDSCVDICLSVGNLDKRGVCLCLLVYFCLVHVNAKCSKL